MTATALTESRLTFSQKLLKGTLYLCSAIYGVYTFFAIITALVSPFYLLALGRNIWISGLQVLGLIAFPILLPVCIRSMWRYFKAGRYKKSALFCALPFIAEQFLSSGFEVLHALAK